MYIVCSDLEGVFTPEVWIKLAVNTGIKELRKTTRDIPDYDVLMRKRLIILKENGVRLKDITDVAATMSPLEGAIEFLEWLKPRTQIIIVSDTYAEFAEPLMKQLGWPTLLCNTLTTGSDGIITDYNLRQQDGKPKVVKALKGLNYKVIGIGDSYNDITMLKQADKGLLYKPPENVINEYPEFPVSTNYDELKSHLSKILNGKDSD